MTKKSIVIITCAILLVFVIIFSLLLSTGTIVLDQSAEVRGESLFFKGQEYILTDGTYSEGKKIAKTKDGRDINEVREDDTHTFIVLRSFLDESLYVKKDFHIPTKGEITKINWGTETITDSEFCNMMEVLLDSAVTDFTYETDAIYALKDNQEMRPVDIAYEGCPVTTEFKGYLGKIDGKFYITTQISEDQTNEDGSPKSYTVFCYTIPSEYYSVLQQVQFD